MYLFIAAFMCIVYEAEVGPINKYIIVIVIQIQNLYYAEPAIVECPPLFRPSNGYIKVFSRTVGSTATYGCITGYRLSGISQRVCLANGMWSGRAPCCVG